LAEFFREEVRFFFNVGMFILDRKQIPIIKAWPQIRFTDFASRFTRRPLGRLARRVFYPPSFWRACQPV